MATPHQDHFARPSSQGGGASGGELPWRGLLVYGMGVSGVAVSRLLVELGRRVVVADDRGTPELPDDVGAGVVVLAGNALPEDVEAVVLSPGVPEDRPLLRSARERGLPVVGEVEIAFRVLQMATGRASELLAAVTGSNGKSTTTALVEHLLGPDRAVACGNYGIPLSDCVRRVVEGRTPPLLVAELSSFQIDTIDTLSPRAAAFLNFSPDHLDRHGSTEAYLAAKRRLFLHQGPGDVAVLHGDDPVVAATALQPGVRRRTFSLTARVEDGCFLDGEAVRETTPDGDVELFRRSDLQIVGDHNLENAMAASLLALAMGLDPDQVAGRLRSFSGLPHRTQLVADRDGVRWYDDSKGTNVGATARSLAGFEEGRVHLILGGRAKGTRFEALRDLVASRAARVYLVGEAAETLAEDLEGTAPLERAGTIAEAVRRARENARAGDVVLLSPACASFDQFENFAERGLFFQREVTILLDRRRAAHPPEEGDGG